MGFRFPSLVSDAGSDLVVPAYIDGSFTTLSGRFDVIGPYTNSRVWESASAAPRDALHAVEAAEAAFPAWSETKPNYRRDLLLKTAQLMEERFDELTSIMRTEMGADELTSDKIILPIAISSMKDIAARTNSIQGWMPTAEREGQSAMVMQVPVGVTVGICAWNAPFVFAARSIATALAAGCTTVIKASEKSPRCYQMVAQCFHDAGLPKGVLNVLSCPPSDAAAVTEALVSHEAVRKVNFTGSSGIGRKIAVLCAQNLKPCVMELGGKNSALVLKDADLENAAREVIIGGFANAGQICMSTDKVMVAREVMDDFKKVLSKTLGEMFSNKTLPQTLVSADSKTRVEKVVSEAIEQGGEILVGDWSEENDVKNTQGNGTSNGHTNGTNGHSNGSNGIIVDDTVKKNESAVEKDTASGVFFRPVVIDNATPSMTVWQEENFGTVLALAAVDDEAEMVRMANSTGYGLSASIFTEDLRRAMKLARHIETGAVHVNTMTVHDEPSLPFGGVKQSGWGRFNGTKGLEEFLVTKSLTWLD